MNTAGWAVYKVSRVNFRVQSDLHAWGLVEPLDPEASDIERINSVVGQLLSIFKSHGCSASIIEKPPDTIYGWAAMSKRKIVARAQSIFRVFSVAVGLYCAMHDHQCQMVTPSQWEPSRKARNGQPIKSWSLLEANLAIQRKGLRGDLHTKKHENIADAITMGQRLMPMLLEGKLPELN